MPTGSRTVPTAQQQRVSALIDEARKSANMSQETLAEAMGVSQPLLSRMLAGLKPMTVTELIRACEALNLVPSDVLREAGY